ncbi:MAG: tetratricopeptide repeat protein [Acidobacteriota bacterium]|nr:tetratricopeptide repeat protein [Acidobacteriota bacterium]
MSLQHTHLVARVVALTIIVMLAAASSPLAQSAQDEGDELRTRAEQGDAVAQNDLGTAYATGGQGVLQNHAEAAEWFRLAAEQGHAGAQFSLGFAFASGDGVPQDAVYSRRWFRLAAEQGHVGAQFALGLGFADRLGEDVEAAWWFQRAAEQGHAGAQFYLGQSYADGAGVEQDNVAAFMWLNLATAYSSGEAQVRAASERDAVAARLSDEELANAQRQTLEWVGTRAR